MKTQINKRVNIFLHSQVLSRQFQRPPPRRELLSPKLLRKAFLMAETENIEDYRMQIMSTFGGHDLLKYDSTTKVLTREKKVKVVT